VEGAMVAPALETTDMLITLLILILIAILAPDVAIGLIKLGFTFGAIFFVIFLIALISAH
jgi:hypothetical protein